MRRHLFSVSVLAVIALLAGCTSTTPTVAQTPPPGVPLPTLAGWPLPSNTVCDGVGMGPTLTLQGSPADGVYALRGNTQKVPIEWPPGYRVVFSPSLGILDPLGQVIATAGDDLEQSKLGGLWICHEGTKVEMFPA